MNKRNLIKLALLPLLAIVFTFGLSYVGTDRDNPSQVVVDISGFNKAYADEEAWGGIRGSATLARAVNLSINTVITNLNYVLNLLETIGLTRPDPIFNMQVGNYWYKLYRNTPITVGSNEYSGRIEGWKVSAGPTYTKAIEFYWDDISNPTADQGILFIVKPYLYDPVHFYEGEMYEVRYKLDPSSNKAMVLSFIGASGDPDGFKHNDTFLAAPPVSASDGCLTRGIVRLTDVSADNWYEFAGVAARECDCASFEQGGSSYYTLAFLAYKASPNYSTARFGWHATDAGDDANAFLLCAIPNIYNYGYFSQAGFQSDGNSSNDGIHPDIEDVAAITFDSSDIELDATRTALDGKTITFVNTADPI